MCFFFKETDLVFRDCAVLYSLLTKGSYFSISFPTFVIAFLIVILLGVKWFLVMVLICSSKMVREVSQHLFLNVGIYSKILKSFISVLDRRNTKQFRTKQVPGLNCPREQVWTLTWTTKQWPVNFFFSLKSSPQFQQKLLWRVRSKRRQFSSFTFSFCPSISSCNIFIK